MSKENNYSIVVCNEERVVMELNFHADSDHEVDELFNREVKRGGNVYLYAINGDNHCLIREHERKCEYDFDDDYSYDYDY